jgi:hypothetical protein
MTTTIQRVRRILSLAAVCGLALTVPAFANEPGPAASEAVQPARADLAGRWEGRTYELSRRGSDCSGTNGPCTLTLDVARCGGGWCGVEVTGAERRCGATALKLDGGSGPDKGSAPVFNGDLSLAKGTEPYVVEVYLVGPAAADEVAQLQIVGDTGGEFRMFRRSFPFSATLAKISDAKCQPESTVSMHVE